MPICQNKKGGISKKYFDINSGPSHEFDIYSDLIFWWLLKLWFHIIETRYIPRADITKIDVKKGGTF